MRTNATVCIIGEQPDGTFNIQLSDCEGNSLGIAGEADRGDIQNRDVDAVIMDASDIGMMTGLPYGKAVRIRFENAEPLEELVGISIQNAVLTTDNDSRD